MTSLRPEEEGRFLSSVSFQANEYEFKWLVTAWSKYHAMDGLFSTLLV